MKRTLFLPIIMLLIFTIALSAQSPVVMEKKYRFANSDKAKNIIQNWEGNLVIIGTTKSNKEQDAYLAVLDTTGHILWKRIVRHKGDDEVQAVIQNMDATYLVAGHTNTSSGPEAWLLHLSDKGETIQRIRHGKGTLNDLSIDPEGNIFVTGSLNNRLHIAQYNRKIQLTWQAEPMNGAGQSIIKSQDGHLIIGAHEPVSNSLLLLKYDINNRKILWQNKVEATKGVDLVEEDNGDILICGIHYANKEDLFLQKLNKYGKEIWKKTSGDRGRDGAHAIIQSLQKAHFIAGYRKPERRAIKFIDGWMDYIDQDGKSIWGKLLLKGEGRSDELCDLVQLASGSVFYVGWSTASVLDQKEIWLVKLKGETVPESGNNMAISIPSLPLVMENDQPFISPNTRGYYLFNLLNKDTIDIHGATAEVFIENPPKGISYLKKIELGTIKAKQLVNIPIPIKGGEDLKNGQVSFDIKIKLNGQTQRSIISPSIETKENPRPVLVLSDPVCLGTDNQLPKKGDPTIFKIKLTNTGTEVAQNVRLKFSLPYKVLALDDRLAQSIGTIAPGTTKELSFKFISQDSYLGDSISIGCRVLEKNPNFGLAEKFSYGLNVEEAFASDFQEPTENVFTINWINPKFSSTKINTSEASFLLKTKVFASKAFEKGFIKLDFRTDSISGSKGFGKKIPVKCKFSREEKTLLYLADCECRIKLKRGKNHVKFIASNDATKVSSSELIIHFRPNLTVLAIGVPHPDLNYTQKDAKDFANAYKQQEGLLFNEVRIKTCTSPTETSTQYLRQQFDQLSFDFKTGIIRPEDQIIIFISSHGQDAEDGYGKSFRIPGSDYNEDLNKSTSLNFETDIINMLQSVNCEKLLFIDACHSGLVADLMTIINNNDPFPTILSSRENELSYEDPTWQNGAFTKVILEAFQNKKVKADKKMIQANSNNDEVLLIDELYRFLSLRVPHIVGTVKNQPQNPYIQSIYKLNKTAVFLSPLVD